MAISINTSANCYRIVNYAVNGSGAGHVTRLVSVSRWLRRYAALLGVNAEIYFLTSSEAGSLLFAERFASFKLPSKTIVEEAALDNLSFLRVAKEWVHRTLELLRPDLLVVDTFPRGYYDELLPALSLCRHKAFIYRPLKESHAGREEFQGALPLYDAILVPEYGGQKPPPVPEAARDRLRFVGPIMVRERDELLSRHEARQQLGIAEDQFAVYVSAGGGGDAGAENLIHTAYEALRDVTALRFVVGAGPLYRGRRIYDERVTWLTQIGTVELMNGFDVAVSAAGYNSFNELMHAGVPTIFLPQEKWADEQHARAERAARAGAAVVLRAKGDAGALRQAVEEWIDPDLRARAAEAGRALVPQNHARDAARALLKFVHPAVEDELFTEATRAT